MIIPDLKKLSNAELLAIYNTHSKKQVTRFSDRKSALRRTQALLSALDSSPKIVAPLPAAEAMSDRKSAKRVIVSNGHWQKEYLSVKKAFEDLNLPLGGHKLFRRRLKLAGTGTIQSFTFTATYKNGAK